MEWTSPSEHAMPWQTALPVGCLEVGGAWISSERGRASDFPIKALPSLLSMPKTHRRLLNQVARSPRLALGLQNQLLAAPQVTATPYKACAFDEVGEEATDLEKAFSPKGSAKPVLSNEPQDAWGMNVFTQQSCGPPSAQPSPVDVPVARFPTPISLPRQWGLQAVTPFCPGLPLHMLL